MSRKFNPFIVFVYMISVISIMLLVSIIFSLLIPVLNVKNISFDGVWDPLFRSIYASVVSTFICIILSIFTGYWAYRFFKYKQFVDLLMRAFVAVPPVVVGLGLLILFGESYLGRYLNSIGIDFAFDINGIILAQIAINLPLAITYCIDGFGKIESGVLHVAQTCGASEWMLFKSIVFPMTKRQIFTTAMILWSKAIGQFGAVVMVAGVVRNKTLVLPSAIYLYFSTGEIEKGVLIAILLFILAVVIQSLGFIFAKWFYIECN